MGRHVRHFPRALTAALCGALLAFVPGIEGSAGAAEAEAPDEVVAFGDAADVDVSFGGAPVDVEAAPDGDGYWLVNRSGEVGAYAGATHHGDATTLPHAPRAPIVDIEPTPTGGGYWLLDSIGGVFTFGDARFSGSLPGLRAAGQDIGEVDVVAMGSTPSGAGYWVLDGIGGVFTFGDARFAGSIPALRAAGRQIGHAGAADLEATPDGDGYWILDDAGGVFTFGDARFFGSAAERPGQATGLAVSAAGYWVSMAQGVDAPPLPPDSGVGRRVVYCNSCQRVWLVEENGVIARSYQVSGRRGVPAPGHYSVFSKSRVSTDASGTLRLDYMTRFAHGRTLAIGFHGLPINMSTGRPIQTLDELGQFRSAGCVRQAHADAAFLWDWAPVGTPVIVTP